MTTGSRATGPTSEGADEPARAGDADALERALAAAGVRARVRADGRLALLSADPHAFTGAAAREAAVRLARAHAFTHVALVLDDDGA